MKYLNYFSTSLLLFYAPITGLLIAVGFAIFLDTFTGVFKSIKLKGWRSIKSRILSNIVSKMMLYELCIIFLYGIDFHILNEFVGHFFSINFMFTKLCAIILIFVEMVSIKENVEASYNIDLWKLLKETFNRAKEIKTDIDEVIK